MFSKSLLTARLRGGFKRVCPGVCDCHGVSDDGLGMIDSIGCMYDTSDIIRQHRVVVFGNNEDEGLVVYELIPEGVMLKGDAEVMMAECVS